MSELELDPWIVAVASGDEPVAALWRLEQNQASALALFSNEESANRYALANVTGHARAWQPSRRELVQVMIDCFRQGIQFAALDPDSSCARRVFDLRQVLLAAKRELTNEAL